MVPHLTTSSPARCRSSSASCSTPARHRALSARSGRATRSLYTHRWTCATAASSSPPWNEPLPGGLNNPIRFPALCVHAAMSAGSACVRHAALPAIPENHTATCITLDVAMLRRILEGAAPQCAGRLIPDEGPTEVEAGNGEKLLLEPLVRRGNRVGSRASTRRDLLTTTCPPEFRDPARHRAAVCPRSCPDGPRAQVATIPRVRPGPEGFAKLVGIDVGTTRIQQCGR